ncbi:uncharacterized protein LOC110854220 [Folsomia candida]|uniref:Uncharacterized protein n=1 Tax=Folsomia candida TaxID=158441 RepID=A0A226DYX4_FOLCA|nr:uncharacterized protein LOC110854220 [Folsomia candida]OXA50228.1 hypothetical protein Fcan01_14684 [Folsomia candida]
MRKYAVSTFGRNYVVDEGFEELPQIRYVFIIVTLLLGFISLFKFLHHFRTITVTKEKTCNYFPLSSSAVRIVICYVVSHTIHNLHFADNIYRPVDYFEPKWLYDRYLFSEMEITFFLNFPISLCGLIFMQQFVTASSKRNYPQISASCKKMTFYIIGSFLTLGHYRIEPPWKYSAFVNFTIAGEGVATLLLAVWLYKYHKKTVRMSESDVEEDSLQLLNQGHSKSL